MKTAIRGLERPTRPLDPRNCWLLLSGWLLAFGPALQAQQFTTDLGVWFNSFSPSFVGLYPGGHPTEISFQLYNSSPDAFGYPNPGGNVDMRIYLSRDQIFGNADDILIGTYQFGLSIPGYGSVPVDFTDPSVLDNFTIPTGACQNYYAYMLISIVDSGDYYDPDYSNDYNDLPYQLTVTPTGPAPTVQSIVRRAPTAQTVNTNKVVWRVTFSQPVNGVDTNDFTPTILNGSLQGVSVASVQQPSGNMADVTVSTGSGSGDLRLDVLYPHATIYNTCGQGLTMSYTGGDVYTLQRTGPSVVSIVPVSPDPMHSPVSTVDVVFSAPISLPTFTYQDITMTRDGAAITLNGTVDTSLVSGSRYRVNNLAVFTAAAGSYTITVNGSGITDTSGNAGTGSASDSWYNLLPGYQAVYVNQSYTGTNANGSLSSPFRTVGDGYQAAQTNNILTVFGGSYDEAVLMDKPLLLAATNGVVNIGRP